MNYAVPFLFLCLLSPVQAATTQEIDDFVLKKRDELPSTLPATGQTRAVLVEVVDGLLHQTVLSVDADRLTVGQVAQRIGKAQQARAVTVSCFGKFPGGGRMLSNDLFELGTHDLRQRLKKAGLTSTSTMHAVCLKMEQGT